MHEQPGIYRSPAANCRTTPRYALGWELTKEDINMRVKADYADIPFAIFRMWDAKGYADSIG
jgi:hypothetical protein